MATGTVKVFHTDRNFGFLTTERGANIYVHGDHVEGGALTPGDVVEYEVSEEEGSGQAATSVTVVKSAPDANPIGRTMSPPPTWDDLEDVDRQRRQSRRRRR